MDITKFFDKDIFEEITGCKVEDYHLDMEDGYFHIKLRPVVLIERIDVNLNLYPTVPERKKAGKCHCGKPIDYSNSDCEEFGLCYDCKMDS